MIGKSIFITGLPIYTKKEAIKDELEKFGQIKFLRIFCCKNNKRSCVNARVKFLSQDSAIKAMNQGKIYFPGSNKNGHKLKWFNHKKKKEKSVDIEQASQTPLNDRIRRPNDAEKIMQMQPLTEKDKAELREYFVNFKPSEIIRQPKLVSFIKNGATNQAIDRNHFYDNIRFTKTGYKNDYTRHITLLLSKKS